MVGSPALLLSALLGTLLLAAAAQAELGSGADVGQQGVPETGGVLLDGTQASVEQMVARFMAEAQALGDSVPATEDPDTNNTVGDFNTLGASKGRKGKRPNFLVIMTDDQDLLLNSTHPSYMPSLHEFIATQGLWLRSFSASSTVCCPSRVNFLTGKFTHNTNVTSNLPPQGGYIKFQREHLEESYLPTWLQSLDYRTYFTGKFLNGFDPEAKWQHCPAGWTTFEPLVRPNVLNYWHTSFTYNCQYQTQLHDQYSTDVLLNKTLSYLIDAARHPEQPFFIQVTPIAPHDGCVATDDGPDGDTCSAPPQPAPRHANLFSDVRLPRSSNFGVPPPRGTFNWVDVGRSGWSRKGERMRELYLQRLRSLRAVDEMIAATVTVLHLLKQLDNTYVIFMSDNGFKIGNHGVYKGKLTAYEEDVRVPFFIRGPGIPNALISDYPATMCDVPATILDLAGGLQPSLVDGTAIPLKALVGLQPRSFVGGPPGTQLQAQNQVDIQRDQVPHEMWVWGSDTRLTRRDYRAIRVCTEYLAFGGPSLYRSAAASPGATFGFRLHGTVPYAYPQEDLLADTPITCYKYVVWCTGVHELYDLMLDPGETFNRYNIAPPRLLHRLDAYLSVQAYCRGRDCYQPYSLLHANRTVTTFDEAMLPAYDTVYATLKPYTFKTCTLHFYAENEGGWFRYETPRGRHYDAGLLGPLSEGPMRTLPGPMVQEADLDFDAQTLS